MYKELDWNDPIEKDVPDSLLPAGDYSGKIISVERSHFPGSAKLEPCKKAVIHALVLNGSELVPLQFDIILNRKLEWKISSFFRAIGQKQKGARLVMDWDRVPGSFLRLRVAHRTYLDRSGKEHEAVNVDDFYDFDEENFADIRWMFDDAGDEEELLCD